MTEIYQIVVSKEVGGSVAELTYSEELENQICKICCCFQVKDRLVKGCKCGNSLVHPQCLQESIQSCELNCERCNVVQQEGDQGEQKISTLYCFVPFMVALVLISAAGVVGVFVGTEDDWVRTVITFIAFLSFACCAISVVSFLGDRKRCRRVKPSK